MTTTERFLQFLFSHQTVLIEILFALILGICTLWLFSHMQGGADEVSSVPPNADDIERAMEKVLERAQARVNSSSVPSPVVPVTGSAPGAALTGGTTGTPASTSGISNSPSAVSASPGGTAVPTGGISSAASAPTSTSSPIAPTPEQVAEVAKLKSENEAKNIKLQELEQALTDAKLASATATAANSQASTVNVEDFQKKIRELESRLGEYEIIEDDIANLSLYKEENTRLKNELQKLKVGESSIVTAPKKPAVVTQAPSVPLSASAPETAESDENVLKIDPDKLVSEAAELASKPVVDAPPAADDKDTGQKLIEEFENFMKDAGR